MEAWLWRNRLGRAFTTAITTPIPVPARRVLFIAGLFIAGSTCWAIINPDPPAAAPRTDRVPVQSVPVAEPVTVTELAQQYDANALAAAKQHRGACRAITGEISAIGRDILGTAYISLDPHPDLISAFVVKIKVPEHEVSHVRAFHVGQYITARGIVGDYQVGILLIEEDC